MASTETSIDVNAPVSTVYNQWTQFEDFPQFMENVQEVRQLDPTHLHWTARVAGQVKEWDAVVTEQVPDERIAWRSEQGAQHAGVVTFHRIDDATTRVMLQLETAPEGMVEKVGEAVGASGRAVKKDLERFKEFIEARSQQSDGWRGAVPRSPQG